MVRCLLLLPLLALLLPGDTSSGNRGCFAFQHNRHLASTSTNGYATFTGSGFDRYVPERRVRNDIIGAATPSIQYLWSNANKARRISSLMAASDKGKGGDEDETKKNMTSDEGWELAMDLESRGSFKPSYKSKDEKSIDDDAKSKAAAIAQLKAEAEAKRASAEAEAKRLKAEADKAAKLKAAQDEKLKEAEAQLAQLQAEVEAREKDEREAAKQQAEAEKKRKQAEEEAAKLEAKAEEEKNRLKAAKKAEEMATLLEAKEEAARVMAEIDAKLRAETIEADKEEAERVQILQSEAQQMLDLDDENDATLKLMMEEMEKVRIELDSRLKAEADEEKAGEKKAEAEAAAKAEAEIEARIKKAEEEAAAKARVEVEARIKRAEEEATAKAKAELEAKIKKLEEEAAARGKNEEARIKKTDETAKAEAEGEEEANAASEKKAADPVADLMQRIKSGASYDPASRKVSAENVNEIPPPSYSVPKGEIIDTTATSKTPPKASPMPDLPSKSKEAPKTKKKNPKEDSKPKWMVNWDKDESSKKDDQPKAKDSTEGKTNAEEKVSSEKDEVTIENKPKKAKVAAEKTETEEDKQAEKNSDPRTKGRNKKENLFDVIGRTAAGGVTMDEVTEKKKQIPQSTPPPPPAEVLRELRKKGPPESFGESVATSHRVGKTNSENKEPRRPMPDLQKKKGPPASFGSFAAAASSKGSPPIPSDNVESKKKDNGPPPSFGASVAMASSGDVPQDLLSRGTASTDSGASSVPAPPSSPSRKRGPDSNIIDVLDVVYTKKDDVTKEKKNPSAAPLEGKVPPSRPVSSVPPLQVEKTVPPAPPLQVQATVPPMKNPPKKKEENDDTKLKKAVAAEAKSPSPANRVVNIGKAAAKKVFGKNKKESPEDAKPKATKEKADDKKDDGGEENAMEDRVASLLKEAFSLSKEDSRVGDLLQGVIAITTGNDKNKEKEGKGSTERTVAKGRKRARQVAVDDDGEDEDDEVDDVDDDFEEDVDYYDDDYEDEDEEVEDEEDAVIMGSGFRRSRRMENKDDFGRDDYRRGPRDRGIGNTRDDRYREPPRPPNQFDNIDGDGYFVDDDNQYIEYDENDRWRGRGVDSRRSDSPMRPGGYSVRPPPQSTGQQRPETDDDYYFLQFESPSSRYDERGRDGYYGDEDDHYYDDDSDSPQPGAPRPAFVEPEDDSVKGPPSTFGNFVAGASMSKTGYAPSTMKDDINGGGMNGDNGEEFGDEMDASTGSMMSPRGLNGSGRASSQGRSAQAPFAVSKEQGGGGGGRKKGPSKSFGRSVAAAGENQTGNPSRRIEEEIANGGMATPTGSMASPKITRPNPTAGGGNPTATPGATGQGAGRKSLFIVSEEDVGTPDFGSSVAEASGARTGWAPKAPKRPTGGLERGTTGGMSPKINQPSTLGSSAQKKEFGSSVFEDCPSLESNKKRKADPPLARKDFAVDLNQKHQRNPAVNLVDGGASKSPPRTVQYSGSMMAPRTLRETPPAQSVKAPNETEGNNSEDDEEAR